MKKYIKYFAAIAAMVLGTSCTQELFHDRNSEGDTFSIEVLWSSMATKSPGIDSENTVTSLDYYFFADSTSAAKFHFREDGLTTSTENSYLKDFVPGTSYGGQEFPSKANLWGTWGEDEGVHVFIVANLPSDKVLASPTLEQIKTVSVDETFLDEDDNPLAVNDKNLFFIMTGETTVKGTILPVESADPETVELYRLAAKITYDVKILSSKVIESNDTTETWTPMLGGRNVRMYPQRVVKDAYLGVVDGNHYLSNATFFDYPIVTVSLDDEMWAENGDYYEMADDAVGTYYTYPNNWKEGGTDTFVKIIVPWQVIRKKGNNVIYSAQREVYYKVLLPDPEVLANTWYQLDITLEPGTENEPEVTINANYKVANWIGGGEEGVDGNLKDIKYLIADRSDEIPDANQDHGHFVTYTRGISIPYSASNPVIFKVIEASFTDFSTETPTEFKFVKDEGETFDRPNPGNNNRKHLGTYNATATPPWSEVMSLSTVESWFKFDNGSNVGAAEGHLVMDHWLNADLTSPYFDASPYTFIIRIYLERDPDHYVEELKIIQYPQTYIEAQESHVKNGRPVSSEQFSGYIFINNVSEVTNGGSGSAWTTIMSIGSNYSGNTNHNMYILTTGVLSDEDKRLGDPREENTYNSAQNVGTTAPANERVPSLVTAPAVSGGNRSLSNYRPTDSDKSDTFIAPKLRISSAFGRRGSNRSGNSNNTDDYRYNYASAWNRCAAYQEDGYPAGRWRLPTRAEIIYVNTLADRGFIPQMFYSSSTPYWSASLDTREGRDGYAWAIQGGSWVSVRQASTRCVYDDWYWGSDPVEGAQNTFMWGD